jgi:two-component system, NtrC family, response regulator HydG
MNASANRELKLLGKSPEIAQVRKAVKRLAKYDASILIVGETGTDKEFIAEHIHLLSMHKDKPFVKIECGAIGDTLDPEVVFRLPQEGAKPQKEGLVSADQGTVYLNRIDKLEPDFQDRLYNFWVTVLSPNESAFSVRFISSALPAIEKLEKAGVFREDLLQMLSHFRISTPSLRRRKQDIPFLFDNILKEFSQTYNKSYDNTPEEIFQAIINYGWPGNVRELRNCVRNLVIMSPENNLDARHLPFYSKPDPLEFMADYDLPTAVEEVEKFLIKKALTRYEGNQSKAARILAISEAALRYKMKKYGFPSAR